MNDSNADRWRVCLHEAAHAVAAKVLLDCEADAVVWLGAGGFGGATVCKKFPNSFRKAVMFAAGKVAEKLTRDKFVPASEPFRFEVIEPELSNVLESTVYPIDQGDTEKLNDEWHIEQWYFARGRLAHWRIIRQRQVTTKWGTRCFVRKYQTEIIRFAVRLWENGRASTAEDEELSSLLMTQYSACNADG